MRIIYDHQVFSLQDAGGAARYHYELIRHLHAYEDVQIEIILGLNNSVYPFRKLRTQRTRVVSKTAPVHTGIARYAINEAMSAGLTVGRRAFDIYHPTLYRALPFIRRRWLVVTHHDCAHERYPELFRNSAMVARNKRRLYAAADAIICVSESSKRDLLECYQLNPAKAFAVHHGFAPLTYCNDATRTPQPLPGNRPYLLFVGFRGTYKNFDALLHAYAESGVAYDYDLFTVGGGAFTPEEESEAKRLGVYDNLKNTQGVSDEALANLYRGAALFVYPSLHEGFGFPPLEAMSMGCPVLVNSTSSLPEVCGDAAFYFEGDDLSRSLVRALNDEQSRISNKKRGYERVACFDWKKTAAETYAVYRKVTHD